MFSAFSMLSSVTVFFDDTDSKENQVYRE